MADAMKLVPVEPTEAMIEAAVGGIELAQKQGYHGLSPVAIYRAMLAASPPAREEAPAEGALEQFACFTDMARTLRSRLKGRSRSETFTPGSIAPELLRRSEEFFDLLIEHEESVYNALRNRTSEPEAGEAVAWRARMRPDGEWMVLDAEYVPGRSADDAVEVQPLYAHPAPATADKLRELIEAAYIAGATNVHEYWCDNPGEAPAPRDDPEFDEAASDYAFAALTEEG